MTCWQGMQPRVFNHSMWYKSIIRIGLVEIQTNKLAAGMIVSLGEVYNWYRKQLSEQDKQAQKHNQSTSTTLIESHTEVGQSYFQTLLKKAFLVDLQRPPADYKKFRSQIQSDLQKNKVPLDLLFRSLYKLFDEEDIQIRKKYQASIQDELKQDTWQNEQKIFEEGPSISIKKEQVSTMSNPNSFMNLNTSGNTSDNTSSNTSPLCPYCGNQSGLPDSNSPSTQPESALEVIRTYLKQVVYASSQINDFCQKMDLNFKCIDIGDGKEFQISVQIPQEQRVLFKKSLYVERGKGLNKKDAKNSANRKLIQSIYLENPQTWLRYKKKMSK